MNRDRDIRTPVRVAVSALALLLTTETGSPALADARLPNTLAWSAYGVGSSGYNEAVAIADALKKKYGVNLRVLPGKNDISRNLALRDGKVQFSASGIGGAYLAQEGLYEFGVPNWGPQPVRGVILNSGNALLAIATAEDANIRKMADLKGKRVAWIVGAPAINQNVAALLAFANLTWGDVKKVEFGGFGAAMDGIINNRVDAAFASSMSGKAHQIENSPRGLYFPPLPHADKAGWRRVQRLAPFFLPVVATEGASIYKDKPLESAGYPYPLLMTYASQDTDLTYNMTKAMVEAYAVYKDSAPGNYGWELKRQIFNWVVPWHEGAINYYKKIGVWKPEHQAHNDMLIKRQRVLAKAWAEVKKGNYADDAAFTKAWMKARARALARSGMDPVVTVWDF